KDGSPSKSPKLSRRALKEGGAGDACKSGGSVAVNFEPTCCDGLPSPDAGIVSSGGRSSSPNPSPASSKLGAGREGSPETLTFGSCASVSATSGRSGPTDDGGSEGGKLSSETPSESRSIKLSWRV